MAKFDPHNHEKYYMNWKNRGSLLPDTTPENRDLILKFINDMEIGANVNPSSKKGARSYGRLRNLKSKLHTLSMLMHQELNINTLADLEDKDMELLRFFKKLRDELLFPKSNGGKPLKAVGLYSKIFKTFWHWYQRTQRRNGRDVRNITLDLDSTDAKPKFNYFTIDALRELCNEAKYDYRVMMMFMFDAGIRSPTELMNVEVRDLEWSNTQNHYMLNIREETSKTFGRRIKLLLCSDILKEYINKNSLNTNDPLFRKEPHVANQYLKNLGYKILKIGLVEEKRFNSRGYVIIKKGLTMYDFRHSSVCYWLPRYKSESALKYRFGWKKSDMIHYYSEFLGMKDTIQKEDLYVDISKTELETQINERGKEIEIMEERLQEQDKKMKEVMDVLKALQMEKFIDQRSVLQTPR